MPKMARQFTKCLNFSGILQIAWFYKLPVIYIEWTKRVSDCNDDLKMLRLYLLFWINLQMKCFLYIYASCSLTLFSNVNNIQSMITES